MKEYKFPDGFLWGSGTAAQQIEPSDENTRDGKSETIWERAFKEQENRFFEGEFAQNNFYEKFKEDLSIAKGLNFNSLRLSISWARLMPDGINVNQKAVDYYNELFDEMNRLEIKPFITLYHFDMPMWAQDRGGWTNPEIVELFVEYAKESFKLFGDKVHKWFTFNEPSVHIEGQYYSNWHYPFKVNFKDGIRCMFNINKAQALIVKEFRKQNVWGTEIGTVLAISPSIPRSDGEADVRAAEVCDLFHWKAFLEPALGKEFPSELIELIKSKGVFPEDVNVEEYNEIFKGQKIDLLGINYYAPGRVKALDYIPNFNEDECHITPNTHFFGKYSPSHKRINPYRGWEIYPKGLYIMLKILQDNYGNIKSFVSENGMGVQDEERYRVDGVIQDDYRIDFIGEHLMWVAEAIAEGANCIGYHMWTYIDNWSWANAYKNRYGYIELDLETNERKEKLSAAWIREVAKTNKLNF